MNVGGRQYNLKEVHFSLPEQQVLDRQHCKWNATKRNENAKKRRKQEKIPWNSKNATVSWSAIVNEQWFCTYSRLAMRVI